MGNACMGRRPYAAKDITETVEEQAEAERRRNEVRGAGEKRLALGCRSWRRRGRGHCAPSKPPRPTQGLKRSGKGKYRRQGNNWVSNHPMMTMKDLRSLRRRQGATKSQLSLCAINCI